MHLEENNKECTPQNIKETKAAVPKEERKKQEERKGE